MSPIRPTSAASAAPLPYRRQVTSSTSTSDRTSHVFWNIKGIDTFINWLTDPHNQESIRLSVPPKPLYAEAADHVNAICNTTWDCQTVNSIIHSVTRRYREAKDLSYDKNLDKEMIREKMLTICPYYDRLHVIYDSKYTGTRPSSSIKGTSMVDDDRRVTDMLSNLIIEDRSLTSSQVVSNGNAPERKTSQKNEHVTVHQVDDNSKAREKEKMQLIIKELWEANLRILEESRQELRRQEKESQRRISENERWQRELLQRCMQEFHEEKEKFKKMKQDLDRDKEVLRTMCDNLLAENAALRKQLNDKDLL